MKGVDALIQDGYRPETDPMPASAGDFSGVECPNCGLLYVTNGPCPRCNRQSQTAQ